MQENAARRRGRVKTTVQSKGAELARTGKAIAKWELPPSIQWVYGFGVKVGVFLVLKGAMIWWYLGNNLTLMGSLTLLMQALMGAVMVALGAILQNPAMFERPRVIRNSAIGYGAAAAFSLGINLYDRFRMLKFFKNAAQSNWFMDAVNAVFGGIKEVGFAILFVDRVLWMILCALLAFITFVYFVTVLRQPKAKKSLSR